MRGLSIVGTLAMFLVGGGLIAHNLGFLHDFLHAQHWDSGMMEHIANLVVGVAAGALACAIVLPAMKLFQKTDFVSLPSENFSDGLNHLKHEYFP